MKALSNQQQRKYKVGTSTKENAENNRIIVIVERYNENPGACANLWFQFLGSLRMVSLWSLSFLFSDNLPFSRLPFLCVFISLPYPLQYLRNLNRPLFLSIKRGYTLNWIWENKLIKKNTFAWIFRYRSYYNCMYIWTQEFQRKWSEMCKTFAYKDKYS